MFNYSGQLLLQQVGRNRRRSPLLWGSSVAAYLFAGESYLEAARRRLRDELELETPLRKLGATSMADNGATKFIELFQTVSGGATVGDHQHIEDLDYRYPEEIAELLHSEPNRFTETFPYVFRLYQAVVAT